ncbi:MAG TPA: serine hydrolase domain-containing protein, partial [Chloroflexota bacterium]|nr:serine hydrolase domain-containing protein [Chloroflexota bacterium]
MRLLIPLFVICELVCVGSTAPRAHAAGNRYAFLSSILARDRHRYGVPGIAMVVVRGGSMVFAGGSGYADLATRTPVTPTGTVFHLANTSAAVTTIAALQLVTKGKLALDADVNRYLTVRRVAPTFPHPVTLSELLANTAGFQDRHIYRRTLSPSSLQPLGPYLAARMPPRVQPPGLSYSYSAYSYALAGLIIQQVTREPFATAIAKRLFRPLHMTRSSFAQRLPRRIARQLAVGYDESGADRIPAPREYFNVAPAEGMVATVADVGHLLEALLSGRRYGGRFVLPPMLAPLLERKRYSAYPH